MFKVEKFAFSNKEFANQALAIREAVFVEEQGVDAGLEYDHEEESCHYLLFLGEKPIATARWRETGSGIKLERFAVLLHYRNRGIGEIILKAVLKDVISSGKQIYLHSQVNAVSFYERNGFIKEGQMFTEAGIRHFRMIYLPE